MNDQELKSLAFKILRWFCPDQLQEEIEGDLLQKFERDLKLFKASDTSKVSDASAYRRAKRKLFWNVIKFFRPGIIFKNRFSSQQSSLPMFKNYFITSLRHIKKSKVNFAFKLGGLSLAIFSFLAIALYVSYQWGFDRHHKDLKNIYRVNSQRKENGEVEKYAIAPLAIGPMLKQYIPEVDAFSRIRYTNGSYLRFEDKVVQCEGLIEADSSIFNILTYQFVEGNLDALKLPNAIVITRSKANTLFGSEKAIQKLISINNGEQLYQIAAVIEDPVQTSFNFEAIILNHSESQFSLGSILSPVEFLDNASTLFVHLKKPVDSDLTKKIDAMLDRFVTRADRTETGFELSFQPIQDIYLGPQLKAEFAGKESPVYVYAFTVLGILLLVVAAINYINLSIADFGNRSRETGVRKVLGARKHQLISQVLLETLVFGILSVVVGLLFLYLLFPQVMRLLDTELRLSMLLDRRLLMLATFGFFGLIFFSSWIPARQFAFSGITQNLKSKTAGYNSFISKTLLLVQFAVSSICIACTLMAGQQVGFIHNKELGINRKNLMVFSLPGDFSVEKAKVLKHKLKEVNGVTNVSNSSFRIGTGYWKDWYSVESENGFKEVELYEVFSDDELFSTLGIKLLDGRTFDANMPADSGAAFVINETAARELGWDDPIGKRIYTHPEEKGKWDGTVVGLVSDINIDPLYNKIQPLVMRLPWQNEYPDSFIYVRYQGNEQEIIDAIGQKYKEVNPDYPFAFRFVDELYNSQHERENKAFASLQFSTFVIVLVSMLGIFSMAAYISIKRMKEFGIRKVLGASVRQIASLHIGYFFRLVLIANIISLPIAYLLIKGWLNEFAYRVDITIFPFIIVGGVSLLLVLLSGGYSAFKSGRLNPVDVIKMD